jgi:hypothetical protein
MKHLFKLGMIALFTFVFSSAIAQGNGNGQNNPNGLVGRAHGAPGIAQCIADANNDPLYEIVAQVETVSSCFAGGFITRVTFYKTPVCHQEPCPRPATVPVAEVTFGCEGEIIGSQCFEP